MKYLFFFVFSFLLLGCSSKEGVYWCGDHACINNKEKKAYFKKTMIVEIRELSKQSKKDKSESEIIKEQAGLENKKNVKDNKTITKQDRLEEKKRIKEEKELAKQFRLEEKKRIREEKKLAKQIRLEAKKSSIKKDLKIENAILEEKVVLNTDIATIDVSSTKFKELVEKITKKNMYRSYPNINDIQN